MVELDYGLLACLNKFTKKFFIDTNKESVNDYFEDFMNYVIASNLLKTDFEEYAKVSTNKATGIDGIAIVVNDLLIDDQTDLERIKQHKDIHIQIGFIQSTLNKSSKEAKFIAFIDKVTQFLSETLIIEPFSSIYQELMNPDGEYIELLSKTPEIIIYYVQGVSTHEIDDSVLNCQKEKFQLGDLGRFKLENIHTCKGEDIIKLYSKIKQFDVVSLDLPANVFIEEKADVSSSIISLVKFSQLKNLVFSKDNIIKESVFAENIRYYLGETSINKDIRKTLSNDEQKIYFPYLNNGITILCDEIEFKHGKMNSFNIKYPRIINGCQTTHILAQKFTEDSKSVEDVEIVVKFIATKNIDLKKNIIIATNNQNAISKDISSLYSMYERIEICYNAHDEIELFFERLRGQYSHIDPYYKKIDFETLAKVYISVFKKQPHKMKTNAIGIIQNAINTDQFPSDDIDQYYLCGILYYYLQFYTTNKKIVLESKTEDMHLLMVCNLLLKNYNIISSKDKIKYLADSNQAFQLFSSSQKILEEDRTLFGKKGLYSGPKTNNLIKKIEQIDGINI